MLPALFTAYYYNATSTDFIPHSFAVFLKTYRADLSDSKIFLYILITHYGHYDHLLAALPSGFLSEVSVTAYYY